MRLCTTKTQREGGGKRIGGGCIGVGKRIEGGEAGKGVCSRGVCLWPVRAVLQPFLLLCRALPQHHPVQQPVPLVDVGWVDGAVSPHALTGLQVAKWRGGIGAETKSG